MSEYGSFPGGERFEPWQDHEWRLHCGMPVRYLGEVGERELIKLSDGDLQDFLLRHDVHGGDPPIMPDMIPPHAPVPGQTWDSTIHHFRCSECGWDLLLWDAS